MVKLQNRLEIFCHLSIAYSLMKLFLKETKLDSRLPFQRRKLVAGWLLVDNPD